MLALSPTLLSAQKSRSARPYVRVTVDDRHVGVGRLRPQDVYSGPEEDGPCALACGTGTGAPGDGYVLRARVEESGNLYLCRTQVGAASGWDAWTLMASAVDPQAQVALAAATGRAYLLYVGGSGGTLLCRRSQDGGLTWSAPEIVYQADAGCRLTSVAAVCPTAHDCICLVADDGQTQDPDDLVYVAWLREGQWQGAAWPRDAGDGAAGLAAVSVGGDESYSSVHFVLCGAFEDTTRPAVRLYHLQLTAEGLRLWTYRGAVLVGDAPAFTWSQPALVAAPGDRPRLFLVQNTGQGSRLGHLFLLRLGLTGPVSAGDFVPLEAETAGGPGAASWGEEIYFGSASRVWKAAVYGGGPDQWVDVSGDVARYRAHSARRGEGRLELTLDGDGSPSVLRPGGQVCLREGYVTAEGSEWVCRAPYWVEEVVRRWGRRPEVVLRCYDGWGKLWRSPADRAYEWQTSPANVLAEALERFGFVYGDDGSSTLYCSGTPPRFSLGVGQPWGGLVERVLDYCGCELRFSTDPEEEETWPSVRAWVFTPEDQVCYSYLDDHPLLESALSEREPEGTWVQVFGEEAYGEALDLEAIAEAGLASVRKVVDARINPGTDVTAAGAAEFALRRQRWAWQGEWLLARPNVGQELMDVVSVGASVRRVLEIETHFDRRKGVYEQRLLVGGK
ncbi:MAG: hypothetical protein HPY83_09850 [Anaerolineae bacterium]|nr:hypothetical protein [Anaerolineae bacterium]